MSRQLVEDPNDINKKLLDDLILTTKNSILTNGNLDCFKGRITKMLGIKLLCFNAAKKFLTQYKTDVRGVKSVQELMQI